jgi:endonuclease/exonuclease/phosphatase family metal-dependent hydrolase
MDQNFPSIWVEYEAKNKKLTFISVFYREWSHNGSSSEESQLWGLDIFTLQIESATKQNKNVILMGNTNLCSLKWETPKYKNKNIARKLLDTLAQCGLSTVEVGVTYLADHAQSNRNIAESALVHVYISKSLNQNKVIKTGSNCPSDHLPVTVILTNQVSNEKNVYTTKVVKRNFKNFTNTKWNEALENYYYYYYYYYYKQLSRFML